MPEERIVQGGPQVTKEDFEKFSDEELVFKFIDIAERGVVDIRTNVLLPPDMFGQWIGNTPEEIAAAQMMGFEVDKEFATKSRTHTDATGAPIVGDVIFMVCNRRVKEAHDKAQRILFRRTHGTTHNVQEERDVEALLKSAGLPTKFRNNDINTSIQERVNASQITSAIKGDD